MKQTRREVIAGLGAVVACTTFAHAITVSGTRPSADRPSSPFRLAIINDELTQDFERACQIAATDFGLQWIELRGMWNKNITELSPKETAEAVRILKEHGLRVTDIASPLFKTDWPGAPRSPQSERRDQFHADYDATAQEKLLETCIRVADDFSTDRIRCFDFWRLEDPKPFRAAINAKLQAAARRCARVGKILLLENEMSCNTATAAESAATLAAVPAPNFMLNWDPGNAAAIGTEPFPQGWSLLPKDRIGHCHCKDVVRSPGHPYEWAAVGQGVVDWVGQLRALQQSGFHYGLSLETHWRGAGTPEASSRISMQGLKQDLAKAGIPS